MERSRQECEIKDILGDFTSIQQTANQLQNVKHRITSFIQLVNRQEYCLLSRVFTNDVDCIF